MALTLLMIALAVWTALPAVIFWRLSKRSHAALSITALAVAMALSAYALICFAVKPASTTFQGYHVTYVIFSQTYYLATIAGLYLATSLFVVFSLKTAQCSTKRLIGSAFWTFHLGVGGTFISVQLGPLFMPRRYVDFLDAFFWPNLFSTIGAWLTVLGSAALIVLSLTSLIQTLTRRKS